MLKKLSFKEINSIRRNKIKSEYNKLKLFKKNVKTKKKKKKKKKTISAHQFLKQYYFANNFFENLLSQKNYLKIVYKSKIDIKKFPSR